MTTRSSTSREIDLESAPANSQSNRYSCLSMLSNRSGGSDNDREPPKGAALDTPKDGNHFTPKGGAVSSAFKGIAFACQVALTCSVALITQASKRGNFHYSYNTLTVPFYSELIKLGLSAVLLGKETLEDPTTPVFTFNWTNFLSASIPALLYLCTNNFNFIIIQEIGALSFQILNNFKIVTAAIIFQIIMKRQLTAVQWRGVLLLTIGSLVSQLKDCGDGGLALTGTTKGYILKTINCTLTSFAGVYCEKFLKHTNDSIHYQNVQLYFWGCIFAAGTLVVSAVREGTSFVELWRGHNFLSISLILNYAFVGLATAFVLKYLDNIAKNFAAVSAMFVAAFAAHLMFGEEISIHLIIGLVVCSMAAELYVKHNKL